MILVPRYVLTRCPICAREIQGVQIGGRVRWQTWEPTRWQVLTHGPNGKRCKGSGRLVGWLDTITGQSVAA